MITFNDIFSIAAIIFLLFMAILGTFSPITIAKVITLWPRFIFPKLFGDKVHPKALKAIQLISDDPEAYADEFRNQLLLIRVMGVIAMLMLCCIITFLLSSIGK